MATSRRRCRSSPQPGVQQGTLGHYAQYYQGFAELRLGRPEDARRTFQTLASKNPVGFLVEAIALRDAEAAEALGDQAAALAIYERLSKAKTTAPDDVLLRLGRSARATGNTEKAIEAFSRIVYEFPFSDLAPIAELGARDAAHRADRARHESLQAGARTRRAPVRRQTLRAGAYRPSTDCARRRRGTTASSSSSGSLNAITSRSGRAPRARASGRSSRRRRARARRSSSTRSRAASSATTPSISASSGGWSAISPRKAGRKRR